MKALSDENTLEVIEDYLKMMRGFHDELEFVECELRPDISDMKKWLTLKAKMEDRLTSLRPKDQDKARNVITFIGMVVGSG